MTDAIGKEKMRVTDVCGRGFVMKDGGPDVFGCCYGRAPGTPQRRHLVTNQNHALSSRDLVAIATLLGQAAACGDGWTGAALPQRPIPAELLSYQT